MVTKSVTAMNSYYTTYEFICGASSHVLRKDPTISYVANLTNLSNESWARACGRYLEADLLQDPSELRM